jgi:hypothetical protein
MTYLLARALRAPYAVALLVYLATIAVLSGSFGDYGHLVAAALGLASYPVVRHAPGRITTPILAGLSRRRNAATVPIVPVGGME